MYEINQIFEDSYPPEAAYWCNNKGNCFIKEIDPLNGHKRFQITEIVKTQEQLEEEALRKLKQKRASEVSKITVTVDGMIFDGDEDSQSRMARTITAVKALGVDLATTTRTWVLADNSIAYPTVYQLAQALALAGEAQTALWTVPYTTSLTDVSEDALID